METIYPDTIEKWRNWLTENYQNKKEIWVLFPLKSSRLPGISYNDAVEVALCYGWIDSIIKSFDLKFRAQRFSKRRQNSPYSQPNLERLRWLKKNRLLLPAIDFLVNELLERPFIFPEDIINRIKMNPLAWENYQKFNPSYQRIRIAYIHNARKRPEEFEKRLQHFLNCTAKNQLIPGHGGIGKYYFLD